MPRSRRLTLGGPDASPAELAFLDLFRCRHDWEEHGPASAVAPSKSKCQHDGCGCARLMRVGDEG